MHTLTREENPNYIIGNIPAVVPYFHGKWSNGGILGISVGKMSDDMPGVYNRDAWLMAYAGTQYGYQVSTYGGGQSHNNTPLYLSVYMWRRTA